MFRRRKRHPDKKRAAPLLILLSLEVSIFKNRHLTDWASAAGLATVAARSAQVDCQTLPKVDWNSAERGRLQARVIRRVRPEGVSRFVQLFLQSKTEARQRMLPTAVLREDAFPEHRAFES